MEIFNVKITLLEDDQAQADLLKEWLTAEGFTVSHHKSCALLLANINQDLPDIVILDWELPDGTGIEVLPRLRESYDADVPVLFTTQRDAESDIVKALKLGADDYLSKPLRKAELLARLNALGRRAGILANEENITLGNIFLNKSAETVLLDGEPVKMTRKDFLVAKSLIENEGKVLSREYLLKTVWGVTADIDTRTVDVHVSRIRRSLKIGPQMGYMIKTIYQHGYRLEKLT